MEPAGVGSDGIPPAFARTGARRSFADLLGLGSMIFLVSLFSACLIDQARERMNHYTRKAYHSIHLVEVNEARSTWALRIARDAEQKGDLGAARRYYDEAEGRAKLARYYQSLAQLYETEGVRFWRPVPVEPYPPAVRLIPDGSLGGRRGAWLADRDPDSTPRP